MLDRDGGCIREGQTDRRFFEGSWVHKRGGVYYLSYSTGDTHLIVYATGAPPLLRELTASKPSFLVEYSQLLFPTLVDISVTIVNEPMRITCLAAVAKLRRRKR